MSEQHTTPADVVRAYAQAKSRADIQAALRYCSPDTVFETIAFQAAATGIDEVARQTAAAWRKQAKAVAR
ncbi:MULTISPECIES: hypothetical protein [Streptosporangium]|uniref:Limonene-1,2-epoxide hydrolase n=1 Tax=Streptosporangium brasiliense TaxID=47480 RepID=A0ABT9RJ98_9ACTN|nr:hypothetical protein [Streptosporangium brasiliense]MDP9869153.1 limonene-1,2-epoxide hydrolase [Streptosporangium brasiliense]